MQSAIRRSLFALAPVAAAISFDVTVACAQVSCGDVITAKVAMTADLSCPGHNPAFTINGGGVNMAGHQLTAGAGFTGVALIGSGSSLSNGSIIASGGLSVGVSLGGAGKHKLENVLVDGADTGFFASSDKNKLKNCAAYGPGLGPFSYGFDVIGDQNAIVRSHSSGSLGRNFGIDGDGNKLIESVSSNSPSGSAFYVVGNANKMSRNTSSNDMAPGPAAITMLGNENKLSLNVVDASAAAGLVVGGDENKVSKTVVTRSNESGIRVVGNFNKLTANATYDSGTRGIQIEGNGNSVTYFPHIREVKVSEFLGGRYKKVIAC
jgi:hypothetical protein